MASFSFHFVLILILGLLSTRPSAGTGAGQDRPIGIAMVHRRPDRDRYVEAESSTEIVPETQTSDSSSTTPSAASAMPAGAAPPIDLSAALAAMKASPIPVKGDGALGSGPQIGDGDLGTVKGGSGPVAKNDTGTTAVFGISGSGSSFVYVFDRSDSMNGFGGRPLKAAKQELIKSLQSLTDRQQFSIIFYNDRPKPFALRGVSSGLVAADEVSVIAARQYVEGIRAYGGTEHSQAINLALAVGPDVIFFLTDANTPRLMDGQIRDIRRRAQNSGTTIHTIEFGVSAAGSANSFLTDLAKAGGGQYRYVNVQNLP